MVNLIAGLIVVLFEGYFVLIVHSYFRVYHVGFIFYSYFDNNMVDLEIQR